jgi:tetratricopeptide (TPR) repeat protein
MLDDDLEMAEEGHDLLEDDGEGPMDPSWPAVRVDVARALAEANRDLPRAIQLASDGIQLGRDVDAHVALGLAYLRAGDPIRAQTFLGRAVQLSIGLDQPSAAAYLYLGEALRAQDRDREARAAFEQALAIDAQEKRARAALDALAAAGLPESGA